MIKGKLYMIPTSLGESDVHKILPLYVKEHIHNLDEFIVENSKTARSYLKKMNLVIGRSTTLKPQQLRMQKNAIYNAKGGVIVSYKTTGEQLSDLPSEITEAVQEQAQQWLSRKA